MHSWFQWRTAQGNNWNLEGRLGGGFERSIPLTPPDSSSKPAHSPLYPGYQHAALGLTPLFKSPPTSASFRLVEVQRAGQCDRGRAASAQANPVPAVSSPSLADRAPGQATASAHSVHHITPPERGLVTITGHCTADAAQRVGRLSCANNWRRRCDGEQSLACD